MLRAMPNPPDTPADTEINPAIGAILRQARDFLAHEHSLFATLNIEPLLIGRGKTSFSVDLPAPFAGPDGKIHQSLLTIILDSILGITVFTALDQIMPIATVNLRTDYFLAASPGERVVCTAECIDVTDEIARVRGALRLESSDELLAIAAGGFMVGTRGPALGSRL